MVANSEDKSAFTRGAWVLFFTSIPSHSFPVSLGRIPFQEVEGWVGQGTQMLTPQ